MLVCPECGSPKWEVVDETDEFVVCGNCGYETVITGLAIDDSPDDEGEDRQ